MSTTEETTGTARPPAWYPDPSGRHRLRWWDGLRWTDRVADGDQVSSDPPVRSAPAASPASPASSEQPGSTTVAEPEPAPFVGLELDHGGDDADDDEDPSGGFAQPGRGKPPPEKRASTGAGEPGGLGRGALVLAVGATVLIVASLLWGMQNHRTANQWRDRGEAVQEELDTRTANANALERALGNAASRGARLADGQESMAELREQTVATVDQINVCARDLNRILLNTGSGDPTADVERANRSCGGAALNGEMLIAVLDQVTAP